MIHIFGKVFGILIACIFGWVFLKFEMHSGDFITVLRIL